MERYTITASKQGAETVVFSVMAEKHEQHIYSEDILVGISKSGAKKLEHYKALGYRMHDDTPYRPLVVGWRF
jgi:hypothetical protein